MNRLQPKKSYGQHFLIQAKLIARIVDEILHLAPTHLLEIGPGKGAITQFLMDKVEHFKVIEADEDMVHFLNKNFPTLKDRIIFQDVLKHNLSQTFDGAMFHLCGNFPYNISSQIIFQLLESMDHINILTGMFQKEMAERVIAKPTTKAYGILSVLCQLNFDAHICFDIAPGNFQPPPKVMSSLLQLKRKENHLSKEQFISIKKFVKLCFQFRRKTLRNNLKTSFAQSSWLDDKYFDRRPEELNPSEYWILFNQIRENKISGSPVNMHL
jgi:16S rRNA (adenine1518-N6/adenine1519-N6)-dimethyltransferase